MNLLETAQYYKSLNLSVVVVDSNKKSIHYWEHYQRNFISDYQLRSVLRKSNAYGIAVICGRISGNLESIDIDQKNAIGTDLFQRFCDILKRRDPLLFSILPIASTKNGGYHFYYRCPENSHHEIFARRQSTQPELSVNPKHKVRILIEKLGEENYAIVPPTPGYQFLQLGMDKLPLLEPQQRQLLRNIASSFNQYNYETIERKFPVSSCKDLNSPFNDFDARGDVIGLLEKHGWTVVKVSVQKTYFRRPGKTEHETSGDFHHGYGLFSVFTSSTDFIPRTSYRPYAVYTILECGGDFKLAAKKLIAQGYGISYKEQDKFY